MEILTKRQESFCDNAGLFGVMIAVACMIQHMIFMIPHWVTFAIIGVYLLCIVGFALLMKKSPVATPLLLISGILIFLLESYMILSLTFSLVILILLIYITVIVTLLYTDGVAKQLKKKSIAEKEEADQWNGVI